MVTYHVLGHAGMLGSTVARRWRELGAEWADICTADHIVNCVFPDSWGLLDSLNKARLIQPSTDAIDEDTVYAITKREVERIALAGGGVVLRTGLVDLRKQPAVAYANWFVNPLTPLEWADLAWERKSSPGLHADGRETVTKYGVALAVAREWDLDQPVPEMAPRSKWRIQPSSREWPRLSDAMHTYREWIG